MALRVLDLCFFQFKDVDLRVVSTELDGGTSLSGISEPIAIDGGGYWQGDWTNANFGGRDNAKRAKTLAWRAVNAGLSGGQRAAVRFGDRWHQPVGPFATVPHSDQTPFSDGSEYASGGGVASTVLAVVNGQTGGLNCTILDISFSAPKPLIGGERFTYVHPTWLDRAAEISSIEDIEGGKRITFQPPIRGGIEVGDALDFNNPRCVMRRASPATNSLNLGLFSSASISMVEDMREPPA
jgi:hypothetical protein